MKNKNHIILWLQNDTKDQVGTMTFDGRPLPKGSTIVSKCSRLIALGILTGKPLYREKDLQLYQNESGYTICGTYIDTDITHRKLSFMTYIHDVYDIHKAIDTLRNASEEFGRTFHAMDAEKLSKSVANYHIRIAIKYSVFSQIIALLLTLAWTHHSNKKQERKRIAQEEADAKDDFY